MELEEGERETVICIVPPLQTLERDRSIFESFVKIDGRGAVDRRYRKISPYSLSSAVRAPIIKV
jgi:hypothetical protein